MAFAPTSYVLPLLFQVFLETFVIVFVALTPACVLVFEVHIPGRPRFFALPRICSFANPSSSAEVVDKESVDSSTGARTSYGFCSNLSNVDLC